MSMQPAFSLQFIHLDPLEKLTSFSQQTVHIFTFKSEPWNRAVTVTHAGTVSR